jgi:methylated-DNA-[protein]-cysteine S-methyltransferase
MTPMPGPHVTPFQQRVYDAVMRIPSGSVTTYGRLAKAVGCPSARAVGQALRHNPFAPRVPCHRVIRADLTPGGFSGAARGAEIRRKLTLLRREGVSFRAGRLADPRRVIAPPDGSRPRP